MERHPNMDRSANQTVTYLLFHVRSDGKLMVRFHSSPGELKSLVLPSSTYLMEQMLRGICRTLVVLGLRFDDSSMTSRLSGDARRGLQQALNRIFFGCERCGDPVEHCHESDGVQHNYCKGCFDEIVLNLGPSSAWRLHSGWNFGNSAVEEHDRLYHGDGFEI